MDFIQGQGKVRGFCIMSAELPNPCSKSMKSHGIFKVAANYFISCFRIDKVVLYTKLSEPSLVPQSPIKQFLFLLFYS